MNKSTSKSRLIVIAVVVLAAIFAVYIVLRGNDAKSNLDTVRDKSEEATQRQQEARDQYLGR